MTSSERARRAVAQAPARHRALYMAIGIMALSVLVLAGMRISDRAQSAEQTSALQAQVAAIAADAKQVADPLAELCRTDPSVAARAGEGCRKAAEVQQKPTPAPSAVDGQDGRGITATAIEAGRLVVAYTDGTRRDVGQVVGQPGTPGAAGAMGAPGRGVVATVLDGVDLVVIYSDGTQENLGRIVGRDGDPGRGITSVDGSTGRLIITFDDGTTQDAGELPRGPQGERGAPPAGWTVQRADGSTERCTRNSGSPDDAPTYSCTASGGTTPPTETTTTTATETTTVTTTPPPDDGGLLPLEGQ